MPGGLDQLIKQLAEQLPMASVSADVAYTWSSVPPPGCGVEQVETPPSYFERFRRAIELYKFW